jgi:hypothetical protein
MGGTGKIDGTSGKTATQGDIWGAIFPVLVGQTTGPQSHETFTDPVGLIPGTKSAFEVQDGDGAIDLRFLEAGGFQKKE